MTDDTTVPPLTTDRIVAYWDRRVASYESDLKDGGTDQLPQRSEIEIAMWSRLLSRTVGPPGTRVLDVGTGTGALALLMAQLGYDVTAVDGSPRMLALVEARARRAGLSLTLHEAGAATLPFANATFDAAVCQLLLLPGCASSSRCGRPGTSRPTATFSSEPDWNRSSSRTTRPSHSWPATAKRGTHGCDGRAQPPCT